MMQADGDGLAALDDEIVVRVGVKLVPHSVQDTKADGQGDAENPTEIPHGYIPFSKDRGWSQRQRR